jgi:hypothetical protein
MSIRTAAELGSAIRGARRRRGWTVDEIISEYGG